jgi:plastocyanin
MTTKRWLIPVFALLLLIAAACGSTASPSGGSAPATTGGAAKADTIIIKNFAFSPSNLTVAPGAKVTVLNKDSATHTVTATDNSFNTGDIKPGTSATFTAPSKAGSYGYICSIHQYMTATLTVS